MQNQYIELFNTSMAPIRALGSQSLEYIEKIGSLQISTVQGMMDLNYKFVRNSMELIDKNQFKSLFEQQQSAIRNFNDQFITELKEITDDNRVVKEAAKPVKARSKSAAPKAA